MICCGLVQYVNMFGTSIGYTVTGGIALVYAPGRPAALLVRAAQRIVKQRRISNINCQPARRAGFDGAWRGPAGPSSAATACANTPTWAPTTRTPA